MALKGALGTVPVVGSLLAELTGDIIPSQRLDRLCDFANILRLKVDSLNDDVMRAKLANENFSDLLEESLQQVARSTSTDRRKYIAYLIGNGIKNEDIDYIEEKHLLKMLGELNDFEVIWLIHYSHNHARGQPDAFRDKHANVFNAKSPSRSATQKEHDLAALQDSYKQHLVRLGLLSANDRGSYTITSLGRLLVRRIFDPSDA